MDHPRLKRSIPLPFSLRTSETNYLNEAYQFYAAIRGRAYYSRAIKEDRWEFLNGQCPPSHTD